MIRESRALRKNGEEFDCEIAMSEVGVPAGSQRLFTIVMRDITEHKQAEEAEALRELDRIKSEFISNVSHELRTPLHSIKGFTKLMLEGKVPDPNIQKEFLTIIEKDSKRLGTLIDSLLDMSRLESGRFEVRKQLLSIKDIIHDALESFYSLAEEKSIILSKKIPAELPQVEADRERLRQVMTNLLSNAIKFSPDDGSIMVKAEGRNSELLVQVIDHGNGIPEEAIPHVFDRFYQVESSMTRSTGGSGLGLYISKQIIEAHGGRIWVESELGKGSTFCFTSRISLADFSFSSSFSVDSATSMEILSEVPRTSLPAIIIRGPRSTDTLVTLSLFTFISFPGAKQKVLLF